MSHLKQKIALNSMEVLINHRGSHGFINYACLFKNKIKFEYDVLTTILPLTCISI